MAFISREVFERYLPADAHRLFADNGWAVDVFFIFLKTHQQHHTLNFCFCQPVFCIFSHKNITPYTILLIDYLAPIAYNGNIHTTKGDNNNEL